MICAWLGALTLFVQQKVLEWWSQVYISWTRQDASISMLCKQSPREGIGLFNPVMENVLVDLCLDWMFEDYLIYLENYLFPSHGWWKLRGSNESVKKTLKSSSMIRSTLKKRRNRDFGESKGVKGSDLKKMPYNNKETRHFPLLRHFPCGAKKAATLFRIVDQRQCYSLAGIGVSSLCRRFQRSSYCRFQGIKCIR